jgi:protein TonB
MKRRFQNVFVIALVVSLLLHFGTGIYVFLKPVKPKVNDSIEVTIIDQKKMAEYEREKNLKNDARQIVEQSEKAVNDEIDEKAKYLSRHNQKVVTETKASKNGKFQNEAKQGLAPKAEVSQSPKQQDNRVADKMKPTKVKQFATSDTGEVELPKLASLKPQFQWDKVKVGVSDPGQESQTDDHLKELQNGPQTLLSSREFIYYSYYARIKERLRIFWEPKIKEKVTRLFMAGRHLASNEEKITRLVITLNANGVLVKVQVMGSAGLQDLDDAAVEAFQQAAPFPNPPKGIVDPDGTIKIRWDFILEAGHSIFGNKDDVAEN